jgi:hypothetical protein
MMSGHRGSFVGQLRRAVWRRPAELNPPGRLAIVTAAHRAPASHSGEHCRCQVSAPP